MDQASKLEAQLDRVAGWIERAERLLFITGAGISADSGLPTYRGIGGLYDRELTDEGLRIEEALSGDVFSVRPDITWNTTKRALASSARTGSRRNQAGPAPAMPRFSAGRPSCCASMAGHGVPTKQPKVCAAPTAAK